MKLTNAQFSKQCAIIAKNAAAWAGDSLTLPEELNQEINPDTVLRFTNEMRARLDLLDEWAGQSSRQRQEEESLYSALNLGVGSRGVVE